MTASQVFADYLPAILNGLLITIEITAMGTVAGLLIGLLGAVMRLSKIRAVGGIATLYVEAVRGTPQILQLFIIFFGLTQFGVDLSSFWAATIWLLIYGGAYATELFRAGISSVDSRQVEAAAALGLNRWAAMRNVILPQAVGVILPALTNFLILQLKASSLAFSIGVMDVMKHASLGAATTNQTTVLYLMAAAAYFILNFPLSRLGVFLEKKVALYR